MSGCGCSFKFRAEISHGIAAFADQHHSSFNSQPLHTLPNMTAFWLFPLVFVLLYIRSSYRRRHFPPGPHGLPVIGNLHQIPAHKPWKQLKQ